MHLRFAPECEVGLGFTVAVEHAQHFFRWLGFLLCLVITWSLFCGWDKGLGTP